MNDGPSFGKAITEMELAASACRLIERSPEGYSRRITALLAAYCALKEMLEAELEEVLRESVKPCPWCNRPPEYDASYNTVYCGTVGCPVSLAKEMAVPAWNGQHLSGATKKA